MLHLEILDRGTTKLKLSKLIKFVCPLMMISDFYCVMEYQLSLTGTLEHSNTMSERTLIFWQSYLSPTFLLFVISHLLSYLFSTVLYNLSVAVVRYLPLSPVICRRRYLSVVICILYMSPSLLYIYLSPSLFICRRHCIIYLSSFVIYLSLPLLYICRRRYIIYLPISCNLLSTPLSTTLTIN